MVKNIQTQGNMKDALTLTFGDKIWVNVHIIDHIDLHVICKFRRHTCWNNNNNNKTRPIPSTNAGPRSAIGRAPDP